MAMYIFTDASVNQKHNIAIGSYLILDNLESINIDINNIQHIQFESKSSTIAPFPAAPNLCNCTIVLFMSLLASFPKS